MQDEEKPPMQCIVCDKEVSVSPYPDGATMWMTHGNYGSTVFDPMSAPERLEMVLCDECLVRKRKQVNIVTYQRKTEIVSTVSFHDYMEEHTATSTQPVEKIVEKIREKMTPDSRRVEILQEKHKNTECVWCYLEKKDKGYDNQWEFVLMLSKAYERIRNDVWVFCAHLPAGMSVNDHVVQKARSEAYAMRASKQFASANERHFGES